VLNQSGESKRIGHVSLCGDVMLRALLYEAAQSMLTRLVKRCWLKAWAMSIARRHGSLERLKRGRDARKQSETDQAAI
jgi:transposase